MTKSILASRAGRREASATSADDGGSGCGCELRWLALGASTGGPAALRDLLAELPGPLLLRVLIVQHIADGFTLGFADWLASSLGLDVRLALDGEQPQPGSVLVAPAGAHLRVDADGRRLALDGDAASPREHRPSVDELFLSLAAAAPHETVAALLTGMGTDGAEGLSALRRAGAFCLAQDEASSVVFGMPRAALAMDAAELTLPPRALGLEIARRMERRV